MTVDAAIRAGRALAESLMLDTARVDEITGSTVDADGVEVDTYTPCYGPTITPLPGKRAGMCKVQNGGTQALNPEAGGATFTVQSGAVHFPVGAFVPKIGLVVTLTAAVLDPNLVGCKFRVTALLHKSQGTAYRLAVEEMV